MAGNVIKFGTDGWRGIIAETFTFENLALAAQAYADYLKAEGKAGASLVVGYDHRFLGKRFASLVSEILWGNGFKVLLSDKPLPTPAVSYAVKHFDLVGGVMITASHNPANYSGFKIKLPPGCSADVTTTKGIEAQVGKNPPQRITKEEAEKKGLVLAGDPEKVYLEWVENFLDKDLLRTKKLKVLVDSLYGVGKTYISDILSKYGHEAVTIRAERNPAFPGIAPEPVPPNMAESLAKTVKENFDVCLVTDGDADRLAAADNRGEYIITPKIALILALYFMKCKGWSGKMIKTVSCSKTIDRFCEKYDIPLEEKPVGFKYIVPYLLDGSALVGTEESGGLGYQKHIPERDGVLSGLLFTEALIGLGFKNAGEAVAYIDKEFGKLRYHRIDKECDPNAKDAFMKKLESEPPKEILDRKVVNIKTIDGVKFELEDDSWLLLRFSGTEPVCRFYAEAPTLEEAEKMTELGASLLK